MKRLVLLFILAFASCIEQGKDEPVCTANQQVDCSCALGAAGFKICNAQGTAFTVCMCQGGADAGVSDASIIDASHD